MAIHLTSQQRVDANYEAGTFTYTYQGDYDELVNYLASITMNDSAPNGGIYTGGSVTRLNGRRGQMELVERITNDTAWWGFNFNEVSKPIKTWLATKISGGQLSEELAKIGLWEQLKENGNESYKDFYYDGTHQITNQHTLKLAEKMMQGIDSYSIYQPVATMTRTSMAAFVDGINSIGKYRSGLATPNGWCTGNPDQLSAISNLMPYWLKTGDQITQNSDGTMQRVESWMGIDSIDTDLYQAG